MRQLLNLLLVVFAVFPVSATAETRSAETHFFQPRLGDFPDELKTVRQENKKGILLFFEMEDCPWCARMKATVLNQSEVQDYFRKHFLIYTVDVNGDLPMVDFAGKHTIEKDYALANRVRATPTLLFIDAEGKIMTRFTGPTRDAKEMMLLGRYVVDDHHHKLPFARFKQSAGKPLYPVQPAESTRRAE